MMELANKPFHLPFQIRQNLPVFVVCHFSSSTLRPRRRGGRQPLSLECAQEVALTRGGVCLSERYDNVHTKLRWRCSENHEWEAALNQVKNRGTWCPHCSGNARLRLADAVSIAAGRGGICLSSHYANNRTHLQWQCSHGHVWRATLMVVRRGTWCPNCANKKKTFTLNLARDAAAARGGLCLSEVYVNSKTPLTWQCKEGHTWEAPLTSIRHSGTWCPTCSRKKPLSIAVAKDVAAARGGACLSQHYINSRTRLHWQCAVGHQWHASLSNVKTNNTWCPQCASGKSEKDVRSIFEVIFSGESFPKRRPQFLIGVSGRPLELDGYCSNLGLAFEYHGEQHYNENSFFNRESGKFNAMIARDRLKVHLCHFAGVRLVIIPYFVRDRWNFIRICLMQWFSIGTIYPLAIEE